MVAPKINRAYIVSTNSSDFGVTGELCNKMIENLARMDLQDMKD